MVKNSQGKLQRSQWKLQKAENAVYEQASMPAPHAWATGSAFSYQSPRTGSLETESSPECCGAFKDSKQQKEPLKELSWVAHTSHIVTALQNPSQSSAVVITSPLTKAKVRCPEKPNPQEMILKSVPRPFKEERAVSSKPVLTELEMRRPGSVSAAQWGTTLSLGAGPTTTMTNPEKDEYRHLPLPQTIHKSSIKISQMPP